MLDKIKQLSAEIAGFQAKSLEEVEQFRIKHLSKKGTIAALFDDFKTVPEMCIRDRLYTVLIPNIYDSFII